MKVDLNDKRPYSIWPDYDDWKTWVIDPWLKKGAIQVGKTEIEIPAGVVLSLIRIELTPYKNKVIFRVYKKYNGRANKFHHGVLEFKQGNLGTIKARYLEGEELDQLVKDRLH